MITIGDNTTISSEVRFITHDNSISKILDDKSDFIGEIQIGNNCFIGENATILYGVTLGDNCIVGTGSVVTHSFESNSIIAGNPAIRVSSIDKLAKKGREKAFAFSSGDPTLRKSEILSNQEKWIRR